MTFETWTGGKGMLGEKIAEGTSRAAEVARLPERAKGAPFGAVVLAVKGTSFALAAEVDRAGVVTTYPPVAL